ncbi:MAG: hypothetical protein WEB60_00275 [Terrimicrobiaceae bacterium]
MRILRGRRSLLSAIGAVFATVSSAITAIGAETSVRFDGEYIPDHSLIEHSGMGWEVWTPDFASPVVNLDSDGRVGAFSSGNELRAILKIDQFDPVAGPIRMEFEAVIPDAPPHFASYVQVGLGETGERFVTNTNPVITLSVDGLLCAAEIGIEAPSVQKAYVDGALFRPEPNKPIRVRCDFDFKANTATIAVSQDGAVLFRGQGTVYYRAAGNL